MEKREPDAIFYLAYFKLKEAASQEREEVYGEANDMLRRVLVEEPAHSDALYYLGFLYENGLGTDRDLKTSYSYYRRAVQASGEQNAKAMYKLGNLLYSGEAGGVANKGGLTRKSSLPVLARGGAGRQGRDVPDGSAARGGLAGAQEQVHRRELLQKGVRVGPDGREGEPGADSDEGLRRGRAVGGQRDAGQGTRRHRRRASARRAFLPEEADSAEQNAPLAVGLTREQEEPEEMLVEAASKGNARAQELLRSFQIPSVSKKMLSYIRGGAQQR